jgi:hypothetical protein
MSHADLRSAVPIQTEIPTACQVISHLGLPPATNESTSSWAELASLPNDDRITAEKSGHIFLIVIDRPMPVEEVAVDTVITVNQHFD